MAGFRTFATGEVLTAANVNDFLMGQSVMRFADATARTAALGTDVVEGMLTYNLATDQLEVFDGTNFVVAAPEPPAGIGSNVVSTVRTSAFSASLAGGTRSTSVISVTITPSSATSKVLLLLSLSLSISAATPAFEIQRGGSVIAAFTGDSGGTDRATGGAGVGDVAGDRSGTTVGFVALDSPASDTAQTYDIVVFHDSGVARTVFVNRGQTDAIRTASSLTAIEVAP